MSNKKRIAVIICAMALIAVVALGGTMAYFSQVTETKTNMFTSGKGIAATLTEDQFKPGDAANYEPGTTFPKNPVVNLTRGSDPFWAGMRLNFLNNIEQHMAYVGKDASLDVKSGFCSYATHDASGVGTGKVDEKWRLIAKNKQGDELYIYGTPLDSSQNLVATAPIFSNVMVNIGITTVPKDKDVSKPNDKGLYYLAEQPDGTKVLTLAIYPNNETAYYDKDGNAVGYGGLPKFTIEAQGYAVQKANVAYELAITELISLANSGNEDTSSDDYFMVESGLLTP